MGWGDSDLPEVPFLFGNGDGLGGDARRFFVSDVNGYVLKFEVLAFCE
jgi:hypothetical protein